MYETRIISFRASRVNHSRVIGYRRLISEATMGMIYFLDGGMGLT